MTTKNAYYELRHVKKNLRIGYMVSCTNCNFNSHNTIYDAAILTNVNLGDFTYIGSQTKIKNANIGKYCSIADDVLIGLGKHPSDTFVSTHPIFFSTRKQSQITFADQSYFDEYAEITIGHDVWIGAKAVILDGVKIGNGAIVASGAIVTRDVPPFAIVGGVPAKVLKFRFNEEKIIFLNTFQWWNKDVDWLQKNWQVFSDIENLQSKINC